MDRTEELLRTKLAAVLLAADLRELAEKKGEQFAAEVAKEVDKKLADKRRQRALQPKDGVTNKQYAESKDFVDRCQVLGVKPTKRAASKYRNGYGPVAKVTQAELDQWRKEHVLA